MSRSGASWLSVGLLLSTLWLAQACAPNEQQTTCLGESSQQSCDEAITKPSLFPPGTFGDRPSSSYFLLLYSQHLAAMGEPALSQLDDQAAEAYRFLWLRTFHQPVALRLQRSDGMKTLVVKQLSGAGGYEPGVLVVDAVIEIEDQEWDAFKRLLDLSNYWQLPETNEAVSGADGASWVLEAVRDGRYHIVDRWSPDEKYSSKEDLKFRDACRYLLDLSGLNIRDIY